MTDGLSECICEAAAAVATCRTRADEARRIVGRLREEFFDLERCEVITQIASEPAIAATMTGHRHVITIEITVNAPDEPAP